MAQLKSIRELTERNPVASGKSFDCQEGLVLLGREAGAMGRVFAEAEEAPERIAKGRQRFKLGFRNGPGLLHGPSDDRRSLWDVNAKCRDGGRNFQVGQSLQLPSEHGSMTRRAVVFNSRVFWRNPVVLYRITI
jgi:hypothetical protein